VKRYPPKKVPADAIGMMAGCRLCRANDQERTFGEPEHLRDAPRSASAAPSCFGHAIAHGVQAGSKERRFLFRPLERIWR
jgi:hypothetical protein